jgi:YD repeat-containing protein
MRVAANAVWVTYTYAGMGYANPHAPTQIGDGHSTTTYSYDNNGNLASAGNGTATTSYSYDYANRLIAILYNNATSTQFGYDAFGQRVFQIIATTSTTTYPSKLCRRLRFEVPDTAAKFDRVCEPHHIDRNSAQARVWSVA